MSSPGPVSRPPILLLANPAAGHKPGADRGPDRTAASAELAAEMRRSGLDVAARQLGQDDDVGALANEAVAQGSDVVVAGGDGTVGAAARAMAGSDRSLGILPLGTFNNIARGAGLPVDTTEALAIIVSGATRRIDAGVASAATDGENAASAAANPRASNHDSLFFEALGVGLDAAAFGVAQVAEQGPMPAVRATLDVVRRRGPISLSIDGRTLRTRSPAITVCNGPYHGFGFALAPDADPADGVLDVVVFRRMNGLEVLRHFLAVARGRRHAEPRVERIQGREVRVEARDGSLPVHADGVAIGRTPVTVRIWPSALQIFHRRG